MGAWKNFDDIEESLTIDEIILLHETLSRQRHDHYRMLGSFQGVDLGEYEGGSSEDSLPDEVIAAERAWQEKKQKALGDGSEAMRSEMESLGMGYAKV